MTAYAEKRKHKRAEVNIHADWGLTRDCPDRGRVVGVSVGGCFIRTEEEIPPGTRVFVHLWLPTGGPLLGEVRYRLDGFGVGVRVQGGRAGDGGPARPHGGVLLEGQRPMTYGPVTVVS